MCVGSSVSSGVMGLNIAHRPPSRVSTTPNCISICVVGVSVRKMYVPPIPPMKMIANMMEGMSQVSRLSVCVSTMCVLWMIGASY